MALFPPSGVLRNFPAATYVDYASPQNLVRPCSTKKLLISELDTQLYLHDSRMNNNYVLTIYNHFVLVDPYNTKKQGDME